MTIRYPRRDFLKTSVAKAGLSALGALAAPALARAAPVARSELVPVEPDLEPLVRLFDETPREKIVSVLVERLRHGMTYRRFLAAEFLAAVRYYPNDHAVYMMHSVHQLSLDVSYDDRLLPLFWAADSIKHFGFKYFSHPARTDRFPHPAKAAAVFHSAMEEQDRDTAEAAMIALARSEGPQQAFDLLWPYGAAGCGGGNIGHRAISVASAHRTLEAIGWRHAEPVLQFLVSRQNNTPKEIEMNRLNAQRAKDGAGQLRPDWASGPSDKGAVLEMVALVRSGNRQRACQWAYDAIAAGKLCASTVWDALFLASAELVIRSVTGRPPHSVTTTNALHYAFRTCGQPEHRLYVLLEAVHWACSFYAYERNRDYLRNLPITAIPEVDAPNSLTDALEDIFEQLPPRRFDHNVRDRSGDDRAMELTYALARKHSPGAFLQAARRLLCRKATVNSHNVKFPVAFFENSQHVSPQWRPHLLAASVHILQGSRMEDNPALVQAREALRRI